MEYKILSLENLPTTRAEEIDYEKEYFVQIFLIKK